MALPESARMLAGDETFLAAQFRNVFLSAWWGDTTVAKLRQVSAIQSEVARTCPKGFVALGLIRSVNANLPADVRAEAERITRDPAPGLRAIAQVIYGSGFAAAAIRSIATGIQLFSRNGRPSKIFDSLENAAAWLAPRMNELSDPAGAVTAADVTMAVRAIVARAAPSTGPAGVAPW
jgi:hypothetical protein